MEENQSTGKKGMNPMLIIGGIIVVLLIAGGIFLGTKKSSPQSQTATSTTQQTAQPSDAMHMTSTTQPTGSASPSAAAVKGASTSEQTVNIEAGSFYFKPNVINAKVGQKVTIVMHAVSMLHNFNIDELSVHGPMVKNGDTQTFSFTPSKAGKYQFYCSVANHKQMGQVGTLTVQ